MTQKRHEERDLCADLVLVTWRSPAGKQCEDWATLEDISSSGACLKVDEPIPVGSILSLQFSTSRCRASVKYCSAEPMGHLLGVEFEDGYRWSRKKFKPMHLLQFRLRPAPKKK